jgi:hypothetical protein
MLSVNAEQPVHGSAARREHEVVNDELPAAVEEVEQAGLSVWAFEDVLLLDPDDRQPAALGCQGIEGASGFLLLHQQAPAGGLPLGFGHDGRKRHPFLLWSVP